MYIVCVGMFYISGVVTIRSSSGIWCLSLVSGGWWGVDGRCEAFLVGALLVSELLLLLALRGWVGMGLLVSVIVVTVSF
jgi:hypothetical protein